VAHVRGIPRLIEDPTELDALVERLTQHHESEMPSPYQSEHADALRARLLDMIVGFEIEITELQGKFKLSQNRSPASNPDAIRELQRRTLLLMWFYVGVIRGSTGIKNLVRQKLNPGSAALHPGYIYIRA